MNLEPHQVVVVVGIRQAGKSTWVDEEIVRVAPRVLVWDIYREYHTRERVTVDELADDPQMLDDPKLSLAVTPEYHRLEDLADQFETFTDLAKTGEDYVLVIDECGVLRRRAGDALELIATQSAHWKQDTDSGVAVVFVAQRATQIPKTARDQASDVVSFRQSDATDIDALVDRCGKGAEAVARLPRYRFWSWDESSTFDDKPTTKGAEKEKSE